MRYLGIDFGTKKVGLALSDEGGVMGFPHAVVSNDEQLLSTITELIKQREVGQVVIGESCNSMGVENTVAGEARAFGTRLQKATNIKVVYEMEAFTTQEARRDIQGKHPQHIATSQRRRTDKNSQKRRTPNVDAAAAAIILTSYLARPHDND